MKEELMLREGIIIRDKQDYDALDMAIQKLASVSEDQFETIKSEKWYNRVFDMITFSQNNTKRIAEQIGTVAQAQQILVELLIRLSSENVKISDLILKSMNDINKLAKQNCDLLSLIKNMEDVSLGIKKDMDINMLSPKGKSVLSACLYKINMENQESSEEQKRYANRVLSYLGIDIRMERPEDAFKDLDVESRQRILSCCMEYMFLKTCSDKEYHKFECFIDDFDVGNKTIKEIKKRIEDLYNLRGIEGFYSKYEVGSFKEVEDCFFVEFELNEDVFENNVEKSAELISSILHIKPFEVMKYENKIIHISAFINCEGELRFENCIIIYNEFDVNDEIKLASKAKLVMRNCNVICNGYDENCFINCDGENDVIFENTTFNDCSCFLAASNIRMRMENCELINCYKGFISMYARKEAYCRIINNMIVFDNLKEFNKNAKAQLGVDYLIEIKCIEEVEVVFENNKIEELPHFRSMSADNKEQENRICSFYCECGKVSNCEFKGITEALQVPQVRSSLFLNCTAAVDTYIVANDKESLIEDCIFKNSTQIIAAGNNTKISHCKFDSCYNKLIWAEGYKGGINIEFCEFIDIKNNAESSHSLCGFENLSNIIFRRNNNRLTQNNCMKNCIFDGVTLLDNFLVEATGYEKPAGPVSIIQDCDFRNCSTKHISRKIIKENIEYMTITKKRKLFHANIISNCKGLDKVMNTNESV